MIRLLAWAFAAIVGLLALAAVGLALPLDLAIALSLGWASYLSRVLPEVTIDPAGLITAVLCLTLVLFGSHGFLRWLARGGESRDDPEGSTAGRWEFRWTASIVGAILLTFVAGIAATGVVHQLGWLVTSEEPLAHGASWIAAQRAQSSNNLKHIGLGLDAYHRSHAALPPGGTFDPLGRPLHGWQARILPFIEAQALHDRIDFGLPWDDPSNLDAFRSPLPVFLNPAQPDRHDEAGYALSHYAGSARLLGGDVPRSLADVTDGLANTILAGEVASGPKPWGHPTNWRDPALGIDRSPLGFGSPFPGGANLLFADGSVRFIKESVDPRILEALGTPDGHDPVPADSY